MLPLNLKAIKFHTASSAGFPRVAIFLPGLSEQYSEAVGDSIKPGARRISVEAFTISLSPCIATKINSMVLQIRFRLVLVHLALKPRFCFTRQHDKGGSAAIIIFDCGNYSDICDECQHKGVP